VISGGNNFNYFPKDKLIKLATLMQFKRMLVLRAPLSTPLESDWVHTLSVVLMRCGYWSTRNLTISTLPYSTAMCSRVRPALSRADHITSSSSSSRGSNVGNDIFPNFPGRGFSSMASCM